MIISLLHRGNRLHDKMVEAKALSHITEVAVINFVREASFTGLVCQR